jgi:hypothetical protein
MTTIMPGQSYNTKYREAISPITVSGGNTTFKDPQGSGSISLEIIPAGAPTSLSVTVKGCMPSGACTDTVATSTATTTNTVEVTPTRYDSFLITATFSGGTNVSIGFNKVGTMASKKGGAVTAGAVASAIQSQSGCSSPGYWQPSTNSCSQPSTTAGVTQFGPANNKRNGDITPALNDYQANQIGGLAASATTDTTKGQNIDMSTPQNIGLTTPKAGRFTTDTNATASFFQAFTTPATVGAGSAASGQPGTTGMVANISCAGMWVAFGSPYRAEAYCGDSNGNSYWYATTGSAAFGSETWTQRGFLSSSGSWNSAIVTAASASFTGISQASQQFSTAQPAVGEGSALASAATLSPGSGLHHVTGTAAISLITIPGNCQNAGKSCEFKLWPDAAFTLATGATATTSAYGIALNSTAVVNRILTLTCDVNLKLCAPSY